MNKNHFKHLGKCIIIIFLTKAVFALVVFIASYLEVLDLHKMLNSEISISDRYGVPVALFLVIIIVPIVEEIAFRGWLSHNKKVIIASLILFLYYVVLISFNILAPNYGNSKYYLISSFVLIPSCIIWIKKESIAIIISSNHNLLIHTSVILFTIAHAFNYEISITEWRSWISLLILLLPYLPISYVLTHIRIQSGLTWSILLHVITNAVITIPVLFEAS